MGQAAVDMAFNTSVRFPNIFMIDKIVGELPLDTYLISMLKVLTPKELDDASIPKDYSFDRMSLTSKLIDNGIGSETVLKLLAKMGERENSVDIADFISMLLDEGISRDSAVNLLRSMGLRDPTIARVFNSMGKG